MEYAIVRMSPRVFLSGTWHGDDEFTARNHQRSPRSGILSVSRET